MDIQTAKQIRIADYLHSLGYSPVKQQGVNLWYKSPLREEAEASFKVNTEREQWYDFGLGKGGGIIEPGCTPVRYRPCTLHLETDSRADTARAPGIFLFWKAKTLPSRASNSWRLFRCHLLPCLPTYKVEELT